MGQTDGQPYSPDELTKLISAVRDPDELAQIGPYTIEELIGEGGMGAVYRARQVEPIQRTVALKVIKLGMDTRQVIARFNAERQALALMDHPNIARVFDAGATESGRPYFVMELVEGEPVTRFADRERLTISQRLELFSQVCDAVQHAHQKAIIHRDLKPSNILVTRHDDLPTIKVIDFGIAKAVNDRATGGSAAAQTLATQAGQLLGTPEYMAPEQMEGSLLDVDTRTDVYSLGVILYELLVGVLPFDDTTLRNRGHAELQRLLRDTDPPRPSTRLSQLGNSGDETARLRQTDLAILHQQLKRELEWIPLKAMRRSRDERYASARELADDIESYLAQRPLRAGPESRAYRTRKFLRRNRFAVSAAVVLLAMLIAGITATSWEAIRATRAERRISLAMQELQAQKNKVEQANVTVSEVNQFLINLLAQADPYQAKGQQITVLEALDAAAGRITTSLSRQPLAEAAIRHVMASTYVQLGRADIAVPHARRSVEVRRQLLGDDNPETLKSITGLAFALKKQGNLAEAETLYAEAVERARRTLGDDDPQTLTSRSNQAVLYHELGHAADALPIHRDVLERRQRLLGKDHPDTFQSLNNVGYALRDLNRLAEAELLYREALGAARSSVGENHPDTIKLIHNLATVLKLEDKSEAAEPLMRDALDRSRHVLGAEHIDTLTSEGELASLLQEQGKFADAEPLYRHAVQASERTLGRHHMSRLTFEHNLATMLQDQGNLDEAEAMFRDVLKRRENLLAPDHPSLLATRHRLASLLMRRGQSADAEVAWRSIVETRRRALPVDHPDTLSATFGLVLALRDQRKYSEAETLCRELVDATKRGLGETNANALRVQSTLAAILQEQEKFVEAEPVYRALLATRTHALGETNPATLATKADYGICLAKLSRFDEALPMLTDAQSGLSEAGSRYAALVDRVLQSLITTCDGLQRSDDAQHWRDALAKRRAASQPASKPN